jgi:O-antigen/teichoic acid export membrane protein
MLLTRARLSRLATFASAQLGVQVLGFASGIVLVRHMAPAQYGLYTLAVTMVAVASVLTELGVAVAVLAIGGRLAGQDAAFAGVVRHAHALHRWLAAIGLCLVLPAFAVLLRHQQASPLQVLLLVAIAGAGAVLNVRNSIALSVARLAGDLALQQKVDLGMNALRLVALLLVATIALDATVASLVNLGVAAGSFVAWRGYLARRLSPVAETRAEHRATMRDYVVRLAPNSLWYVVNGQLAVWLVGIFGTADRVADVGALGRLGAGFAVIAAVMGGVIQPYFARNHASSDLESGFVALNAFFAVFVAVLGAAALVFPSPILWILGAHYAGLHDELVWMLVATGLAAWAAALYTIGSGRGWVLPSSLGISSGIAATVVGLAWFDVSTVAGTFKLNTLTAAIAVALNFAYLATCLLRHRRQPAVGFDAAVGS